MKRLISLLLLFYIGLPLLAQQQRPAQTPKRDQKKKEVAEIDTIPLYNGTYVGVDLYGVGSKLLGGDFMSSEVSVAVNLKNKFIPTIEFGMGGTDTWSETGIHYKSKMTPFFRIGVDYNTMAKKKEKNSYLYAGLRYAFSSFKYDVSTMPADDPIWGDVIGNPSLEDGYWGGSVPFSNRSGDGLFRCLNCKRYYFETYPLETHANHGFCFRLFSGNHAIYRMDVCKDIQSSYRKCRPLDCFRDPCLLRRTNDFRIFQRRRML